jgi:O-antigen/teichoic acid export membrane protein
MSRAFCKTASTFEGMSTIRRQTILSSGLVYLGFGLGFIYTYLVARTLTPEEYGLTNMFLALGSVMFYVSNFGVTNYIYKFYPYYHHHLPPKKNDMMSVAMVTGLAGFAIVVVLGIVFKGLVIRKYSAQSPELVHYYYWIFPFGLGLSLFTILEAYGWQLNRSILTNGFREVVMRLLTILLVVLFSMGIIRHFDTFIKCYAFAWLTLTFAMLGFLLVKKELFFTGRISRVTWKFRKSIIKQAKLVWVGQMSYNVSLFFAQIIIAAVVPGGLKYVAFYTLAQFITSIVQAPQRGVIAASINPLSHAWKDKDYPRINRIYRQSSINQLIFSAGMYALIWMNFRDGVLAFHLPSDYLEAQKAFLFIGLMRVIDMGTGVTNQIIGTSTYWRFDFGTGVILVLLTLPLNYLLTKAVGFTGPAIADLITFSIYNGIRWVFLLVKFRMQPFTWKTFYTLLLIGAVWWLCELLFAGLHGLAGILVRSSVFAVLYGGGVLALRLSDDIVPIWDTVKKRLGLRSNATR